MAKQNQNSTEPLVTTEELPPPVIKTSDSKFLRSLTLLNKEAPGLLALLMVLTYCVTVIFKIPVDDKFIWAISIILSFYFGSKKGE